MIYNSCFFENNHLIVKVALSDSNHSMVEILDDADNKVSYEAKEDPNGSSQFLLHLSTLNIYKKKYFLVLGNEREPIDMDRYKVDLSKTEDEAYMTKKIFNHGTREFTGDELFFVCFQLSKNIKPNSRHALGLITVMSYRIAEKLSRVFLIDFLVEKKDGFDKNIDKSQPTAIRWYFSSTSAISGLLLGLGRYEGLEKSLQNLSSIQHYIYLVPIAYSNYCLALFMNALFSIKKGDGSQAIALLIKIHKFGKMALQELSSPRNPFYFAQHFDVVFLQELSYLSILIASKYDKQNILSKAMIQIDNPSGRPVDLAVLFKRYPDFYKKFREVNTALVKKIE